VENCPLTLFATKTRAYEVELESDTARAAAQRPENRSQCPPWSCILQQQEPDFTIPGETGKQRVRNRQFLPDFASSSIPHRLLTEILTIVGPQREMCVLFLPDRLSARHFAEGIR